MNTKPKIRPLLVVIISSALLACVPELMAARPSPPQIWSANQFYEVWNGYGSTSWSNTTLTLLPKAPTEPSETHSALVVSKTSLKPPYRVQFNLTTVSQLRLNSPPYPWEVGWFVFGYKQDGKFKYILLKPNGYGIEFGESLLNDAQNYLYTSPLNQDFFPIGQTYAVDIEVKKQTLTLTISGIRYLTYTLSANDQLNFDGKIGFYSENAKVLINNVRVTQ
jgi:hypothetical protein